MKSMTRTASTSGTSINIDYDSVESCYDDETDSYDYDKIDEIIESRFY